MHYYIQTNRYPPKHLRLDKADNAATSTVWRLHTIILDALEIIEDPDEVDLSFRGE
jgi:hypothetical protein